MRRGFCAVMIAFMLLPAAVDGRVNTANFSTQNAWPQWLPAEDKHTQQQPEKLASNTDPIIESSLPAQDKAAKNATSWQANWTREPASLVWNDLALKLVVKYRLNPLRASRTLALLHVANYEAVRLATREKLPKPAQALALHSAASAMLDYLFPLESPGRYQALGRAAYLAHTTTESRKVKSSNQAWELGQQAAVSLINRALLDGASLTWNPADQPAITPGHWRPAPPVFARFPTAPLAARWRTWLEATRALGAPPPVLYDSPAYWAETQEVLWVNKALTVEQKKVADDWNLDQGSVTPSGVWNLRAAKLIEKNHLDTVGAARVFSALNVAMADAMIAAWRVKYESWTQRPVTAIQEKFDPKFMPYLVTPSFPSYVSAHGTVSGAASVVLAGFFPEAGDELQKAAAEAALSRLYGGIHFSSDNNQGLALGRRVGEIVLQQLQQASANNSHKAGKGLRTQGN